MGYELGSFGGLCVREFLLCVEAHKIKSGYVEDPIKDTDDLDDMYAAMASKFKPEDYH
jgi:hypothetical protein